MPTPEHIPEITVEMLRQWRAENRSVCLVDVRQEGERDVSNIEGSVHVPLSEISHAEFPADVPLVVFCHAGVRSAVAVYQLHQRGYENAINLAGGMVAWERFKGA